MNTRHPYRDTPMVPEPFEAQLPPPEPPTFSPPPIKNDPAEVARAMRAIQSHKPGPKPRSKFNP